MLEIRLMASDDVAVGLRLREEAGWNQTEQDWRRFLALSPGGCFVALWQGQSVGTVTTCVFQPVAWIGMMLVDSRFRRRGIGQALMQRALDHLEQRGVQSIRLDATPLGLPLYQKLGFQDQFVLVRYGGQLPYGTGNPSVARLGSGQLDKIVQLDRLAVGVDRSSLLACLIDEQLEMGRAVPRGDSFAAYLLSRPGCRAAQIGPCIALGRHEGRAILGDALSRLAGQTVYIDVPVENLAAVELIQSARLRPLRQLTRMCRGDDNRERIQWLWASSGPEKG